MKAGRTKKNAVRQDCVKSTPKDEGGGDICTIAAISFELLATVGFTPPRSGMGRIMHLNPHVKQGFCALHYRSGKHHPAAANSQA
jgi:hypothetical protein